MKELISQQSLFDLENLFLKKDLPSLKIGDNLRIGVEITEGNKKRVQFYEGILISKNNARINFTITVRKIFQGVGIERVFLLHSPKIKSITILNSVNIRRSKLYYLRNTIKEIFKRKSKF
uniref:50S ribosomal protein L19, chloroplastic n=1 Tax=Astrosyne radiata TaxID=1158023 RepID=A0A2U9NTF1_9STRA|nr:ribosomal protein L19 [Astrosyne radiata]AWT40302.1 ribosomal protein L19 [Astrosyne radiata]